MLICRISFRVYGNQFPPKCSPLIDRNLGKLSTVQRQTVKQCSTKRQRKRPETDDRSREPFARPGITTINARPHTHTLTHIMDVHYYLPFAQNHIWFSMRSINMVCPFWATPNALPVPVVLQRDSRSPTAYGQIHPNNEGLSGT